jgi:transportin-3
VQAMLEVAAFPEDSICAISFNFWHRLSRLLTSGPPGQLLQLLPAHI